MHQPALVRPMRSGQGSWANFIGQGAVVVVVAVAVVVAVVVVALQMQAYRFYG